MATDIGLYSTIRTVLSGYYSKQIGRTFKTVDLRPAVCSLMQKAVIHNTCRAVRFLAKQ